LNQEKIKLLKKELPQNIGNLTEDFTDQNFGSKLGNFFNFKEK
jgi:hypothetical protein